MLDEIDFIITKVQELSQLLENHEITKQYKNTLELMKNDYNAQKIFSQLVILGQEINEKILKGETIGHYSAENEILQKELNQNNLVKNHIQAQKEYLNLIQMIIERIKNPIEK